MLVNVLKMAEIDIVKCAFPNYDFCQIDNVKMVS